MIRRVHHGLVWIILICIGVAASSRELAVPADFLTIQSAIDTTEAGDVIVVSAGRYDENLTVFELSVHIRSASEESPLVHPRAGFAMQVTSGFVSAENIHFHGADETFVNPPSAAFECTSSEARLTACTVTGGAGQTDHAAEDGGAALIAIGSASLELYGCSLVGGAGAGSRSQESIIVSGDGGQGLIATDVDSLRLQECTLSGGDGGYVHPLGFRLGDCGNGGAGLHLTMCPDVTLQQVVSSGGRGGSTLPVNFFAAQNGHGGDGVQIAQNTAVCVDNVRASGGIRGNGVAGSRNGVAWWLDTSSSAAVDPLFVVYALLAVTSNVNYTALLNANGDDLLDSADLVVMQRLWAECLHNF